MRRLRIFEHVSLDGVIEVSAPGEEGSFAHADWTAPYRSPAGLALLLQAQGSAFDLLLGRRTYDLWSRHWPTAPPSPMANLLNAAVKHVVTHRPESLCWGPHRALGTDLVAAVRSLKAQGGPDLLLWGSSTLTSILLGAGLVDEVTAIIYPVLLGHGKRLFESRQTAVRFSLQQSQVLPSGICVNTYLAAGLMPGDQPADAVR